MSKVRAKERAKAKATAPKKRKTFRAYDMKDMQYWTLCDAMRYVHHCFQTRQIIIHPSINQSINQFQPKPLKLISEGTTGIFVPLK